MIPKDHNFCVECGRFYKIGELHFCSKVKARPFVGAVMDKASPKPERFTVTVAKNGWIIRKDNDLYVARTWDELDTFISVYARPRCVGAEWKP